ncbi:hypothetical protein LHYA1_G003704 [Lachnellula hyalina]|uniref:Uncharacterized protein n=1 Tax=Lachnellula hyalina TaxID=1316788 RepID=A0A8H8R5A4_9HELO|nr:uncharacterized protein LHYA1_G003704 [Lachnellula hyalina]TVY28291.1 hypothetical protein LHYA1_G003704 [Lachnellula hyalina]
MSQRPLIKGPLRAPLSEPYNDSYTQAPSSKNEVKVSVKRAHVMVVEVTHEAFAQPFLNPSIIQERIKDDRQWRIAQEKEKAKEPDAASSSQAH